MESGRSLQETLRARGWHDIADELLLAEAFPDVVGVNIPNGLALELPLLSTSAVSTLFSVDAQDFRWLSIQIIAQGTTSTVVFEQSNDNATWVPLLLSPTAGGPVSSTTLTGVFAGPVTARFVRARVTGISALTTTITAEFWYGPQNGYPTVAVGGVASGVADDGSAPVKVGGVASNVTPTGVANGARRDLALSINGAVLIGGPNSIAGFDAINPVPMYDMAGNNNRPLMTGYLFNGTNWDRPRTPIIFKLISALAIVAGTPQAIWTPGAGKKFRLMGWAFAATVDSVLLLKDAATEIAPGRIQCRATSNCQYSSPIGNGVLSALANNALNLDATVGATISGYVFGVEE